jgi:RNA polymerase sigma-70 factor, ECF subfamily
MSARITRLYEQHGDQLRRFLWGVLRDNQLASDVLQATFVTMIESGGPDREEAEKAWLFRVAYHQALAIRRREALGERVGRKLADALPQGSDSADQPLIKRERLDQVRFAVGKLPAEQQQIVRMRIHESKSFAEIANELGIPLGTALSRMRAALKKLRKALADSEQP